MKLKLRTINYSFWSILIILVVWQAVAWLVFIMRGVDFPDPIDTFTRFFNYCSGEQLYNYSIWRHIFISIFRWFTGYIVAVVFGVLTGFILGTNKTLNRLFVPFIHVLQLIPGLAWIPIALLLFGLGNISTIFMIFIIAFSPIVLITSTGIKNTPADLIHAAQIMGANRKKMFIHVLFPSALFHIIDGMRIGLANSWRVLIAAEMIVGTGVGLGYIIIQSRWTLDYTSAFVSILVIVFIGLTVEKLIFNRIEKKLRRKYGKEFTSETITND